MKAHNLSYEEKNNNPVHSKLRKENHQQALNYIIKILEYNKEPKIKQYNNLKILKENEEECNKKLMKSNCFKNIIHENDIVNNNDISYIFILMMNFLKSK